LYFAGNYSGIGNELWAMKDTTTVGINRPHTTGNFSIYPNPNNGNFTITLRDAIFKQGTVTVYDIMGSLLKSEKLISTSQTIHLDAPKGIYLVKLQLDDAVMTKRVVVE
jgi:hypothetical protein